MAFKTIQVNLEFNANVTKARQQMQELQTQLNSLSSQPISQLSLTPQLQQAQQSAMQLKIALNNAMNVNTGKLNLNKFQAQLKQSGLSVQKLAADFSAMGPAGAKAFGQLSSVIAQADTRMISLGARAKSFMTSIAHSAKYQIASTMIYGTINAFSQTLEYAKELDTSLNNIRIVTGKGADEMARFAKEANKMAKELSTSTTKYSDASLIYFQQGLNDAEVKKRTDVTVKLANVVGESAQEVSEWMTAIWNNFDDGSESLEYYADVLTKLGAATASSADEIAAGLEKFAAVAETVGLSYEYATSALATITAETRQSADVVGTALKTLFARMESLKFGDTLEDGTTLGQYSLALEKVGVNIKDANDELKDMDTILEQTGARWNTLSNDQQVALAQSVAGIRQYTQFMALMDNWDVMQKNLELTEAASGALAEQQAIYEESTKASEERLKAATEEFKTLLIGGENLTKIYDFFGGFVEFVTDLTDSFGGLRGILLGVVAVLTKMYQPQIATMFQNMGMAIQDFGIRAKHLFTQKGPASLGEKFQLETLALNSNLANQATGFMDQGSTISIDQKINELYMQRVSLGSKLTQSQQQQFDWAMQILNAYKPQIEELQEKVRLEQQLGEKQRENIENKYGAETAKVVEDTGKHTGMAHSAAVHAKSIGTELEKAEYGLNKESINETKALLSKDLDTIEASYNKLGQKLPESFNKAKDSLTNFTGKSKSEIMDLSQNFNKLETEIKETNDALIQSKTAQQASNIVSSVKQKGVDVEGEKTNSLIKGFETNDIANINSDAYKNLNKEQQYMTKNIQSNIKAYKQSSAEVTKLSRSLGAYKAQLSKAQKAGKDTSKIEEKMNKVKAKLNTAIHQRTTAEKKLRGGIKALNQTNSEAIVTTDGYNKKVQEATTMENQQQAELAESTQKTAQLTEQEESLSRVIQDVLQKLGLLNGQFGNPAPQTFAMKLSKGISAISSFTMALNMLYSAGEQVGEMFAGDFSISKLLSSLSSTFMSIMMVISAYSSLKAAQQAKIQTDKQEIASSGEVVGANIGEAISGVAAAIAKNWPIGLAVAGVVFSLLAAVGGAISGFNATIKAKKEEELNQSTENIELINENQELANSVSDLTDKYKALKAAGESTTETLEEMKDKIPELIDSYKELAKTLSTTIDLTALKEAYDYFLKTGDILSFEKEQEKTDKLVADQAAKNAEKGADLARELAMGVQAGGNDGRYENGKYKVHIGGEGDDEVAVANILKKEFSKIYSQTSETGFWGSSAGGVISFDASTNAGFVEGYNQMLEARSRIEQAGWTDSDTYREINRELAEMKEYYEQILPFMDEFYGQAEKSFLIDENSYLGEYADIKNLQEFEAKYDEIITHIKSQFPNITTEQTEILLKQSKILGGFAKVGSIFDEEATRTQLILENMGEKGLTAVKEWYSTLPEGQRSLVMGIDFSLTHSLEDVKAALEEEWKKTQEASILSEALKLEIDESTFENYVENFAEVNEGLDKNSILTQKIALNNLKLQKGLDGLIKSWDKTYKTLRTGNKATIDYAEAISELQTSLEDMFGVKPSQNYIEEYLEEINKLASGDLEVIDKLQNAVAEDYILHMEYSTPNNDTWEGSILEAQQVLQDMLKDIDTSIAIGEGSSLSGEYLDSLQDMLDAGVITSEQLEKIFQAKGYSYEVTDWKRVPGATKGMTRTTYQLDSDGTKFNPTTEYIEETEEILVPIINGKGPNTSAGQKPAMGTGENKVTVKQSTNTKNLNTTAIDQKAKESKEKIKELEDELDRYHKINEIISDTERELNKLARAKDRVYGASKLALMQKEIDKQKELIDNNRTLLDQMESNLTTDKQNLIDNTNSKFSIEFDEYGRIANYEDLERDYVNLLKNDINNEELQQEYEDFKEAAKKYEDTLNGIEDQYDKLDELQDEFYSKNLEKIEYTVQIKVDMAVDDKAYIDFLMQTIEDDAFAAADAIGLLGREAEVSLQKIQANQEGIAAIERAVANGEITPEQGVEKLREYRNELIDLNADLLEIRQIVQDKLTEAFEAWNEKIEEGISKLEFYSSVLEGYQNIIDIVGKDMLGVSDETMANLNKAMVSNANDIIRSTKAQLDANEATLASMREAREAAAARGDEESVKEWDEQIKLAEEKSQELSTTLQDALTTGLEAAVAEFENTINRIADSFSKAVSGIYDSIEEMREGWDRQQEVAERYLNTYKQTYELNKLNRQIQKSIDSTDNVNSQKQLRALQQEMLEMSKDGQQLSKYDLEYLQKKYDLMVAEQAFRDAQNAKSVVRLTRDSEGNFGYVYTADQGAVDNAQQNYEDKLYAYQEYVSKMDMELTEYFISTQEKMQEEIQAAAEKYGYGTEAFFAEVDKIKARYAEDMKYITTEYSKMTDRNIDINSKFNAGVADSYNETFLGRIQPDYEDFERMYSDTTEECSLACDELNQAIIQLEQTVDYQLGLAGTSIKDFERDTKENLKNIREDSEKTAEAVKKMANGMKIALVGENGTGGAISAVVSFQQTYSGQMSAIRTQTQNTINIVNGLIDAYREMATIAGIELPEYIPSTHTGGAGKPVMKLTNEELQDYVEPPSIEDNTKIISGAITANGPTSVNGKTYFRANDGYWYDITGLQGTPNADRTTISYTIDKNLKGLREAPSKIKTTDYGNQYYSRPIRTGYLAEKEEAVINSVYDTSGKETQYMEPWETLVGEDGVTYCKKPGTDLWYRLNEMQNYSQDLTYKSGSDMYGYTYGGIVKKIYVLTKGQRAYRFEQSFDTGGYTGAWGPEGRLAMLHQKEIVLNAHDTENFLAAIGIVRDISDQIEKNAVVMQYENKLNSLKAALSRDKDTLQQNVYITAEFPNATNHTEIEEAFKNLSNLASQYANRK